MGVALARLALKILSAVTALLLGATYLFLSDVLATGKGGG